MFLDLESDVLLLAGTKSSTKTDSLDQDATQWYNCIVQVNIFVGFFVVLKGGILWEPSLMDVSKNYSTYQFIKILYSEVQLDLFPGEFELIYTSVSTYLQTSQGATQWSIHTCM